MKIISGDEFGIIKSCNTKTKAIEATFGNFDTQNEIVNIYKDNNTNTNTNDDDVNHNVLYVSTKCRQFTLDWERKQIISEYKLNNHNNKITSSTLKAHEQQKYNSLISSLTSNDIVVSVFNKNTHKAISNNVITPLPNANPNLHIKLNTVVNSIYNCESVYTLYENMPMVLFNVEQKKIEFKAKNLPHDELNLKIPIYDTSACEVKSNPRNVYVATGYGDIRLYDMKASAKPVVNKNVSKNKINKIIMTKDENCVVIADVKGYCAMLDVRKGLAPFRNFRGNHGSVRDVCDVWEKECVVIGGFDRFVKWYSYRGGDEGRVYVKNKINAVCVMEVMEVMEENEGNNSMEDEDEEDDDDEIGEIEEDEDDEGEEEEDDEGDDGEDKEKDNEEKEEEEEDIEDVEEEDDDDEDIEEDDNEEDDDDDE